MSQVVGGLVPLVYFFSPNKSALRLGKAKWNGVILFKTFTNGSSELLSNIAMSIVSILYNLQLIRFAGENGIAAYGCLMYVGFIFAAVFLGWGIGTSPIVSYHYGAENRAELQNLYKKNLLAMGVFGLAMFVSAEALSVPFSRLFTGYDEELFALTKRAFHLYSFSFLLTGFNMFGSLFFTALNNGLVSALISFMRTLVFQVLCVFILPALLGIDGIWLSGISYEILSAAVVAVCLVKFRKRYGY
jgi:Na+-driven multidrug efflux pump